jgi:hypothetical protein
MPEFYGFKDLAEELRNTLFRSRDPFTGIYKNCNIIYNRMINELFKTGVIGKFIGKARTSL